MGWGKGCTSSGVTSGAHRLLGTKTHWGAVWIGLGALAVEHSLALEAQPGYVWESCWTVRGGFLEEGALQLYLRLDEGRYEVGKDPSSWSWNGCRHESASLVPLPSGPGCVVWSPGYRGGSQFRPQLAGPSPRL